MVGSFFSNSDFVTPQMMHVWLGVPPPVLLTIDSPSRDPINNPRNRLKIAIVVADVVWKIREDSESRVNTCSAPGAL